MRFKILKNHLMRIDMNNKIKHFSIYVFLFFVWFIEGLSCSPSVSSQGEKSSIERQSNLDAGEPIKNILPKLDKQEVTSYVNPLIGTGGAGFAVGSTLPGATAPFGMVKISPDTTDISGIAYSHCAGYAYGDQSLVGFSHIHLHGTGVPDYGNLLFIPILDNDTRKVQKKEHRTPFKHSQELASVGYYSVILDDTKIKAEFTATPHVAFHRYTFPKSKTPTILIRLDHSLPRGTILDSSMNIIDTQNIEGWLYSKGAISGRFQGFKLYFVIFSTIPFHALTWKNGKIILKKNKQQGSKIGAYLQYPTNTQKVEFLVGLSFTSIAQAKNNLKHEIGSKDFDTIHQETKKAWESILSNVKIAGGTQRQRTIFYTALYHSYQMPTILSDVDGSYIGIDKKKHLAKNYVYYSDFSLWDTYRTLHPLLVLLQPDIQKDMVRSLISMSKDGGYLPRWPLATGYTGTMVGESSSIVIADTYIKGIRDFDVESAYQSMRFLALNVPPKGSPYSGRSNVEFYAKNGYIPADKTGGAASLTLEYAYNDYAIAQLAHALGKKDDYSLFLKRSKNYRNIWDAKTQFFRAKKSDGTWLSSTMKPTVWTKDYVEGNAWQYLWFVPYDTQGLASLFGNKKNLLTKLDLFFENSQLEYDVANRKLGLKKYYWHGNEPDIHAATLYLLYGKANDARKWLRWIMKTRYSVDSSGLAGNDDAGTLSSWYVFNAIGLYPIPAQDIYLLTSPVFTRIQLNIKGKMIEILAPKTSPSNKYVAKIYLNGKELQHPWIKHSELLKDGNTLLFEMRSHP